VLGYETRRAIEEPRQVRRRSALRILQRRPVAKPDEDKELIQLGVAVDGQRPPAQVGQRNRVFRDDRRENNAHPAILTASAMHRAAASAQ